MNYYYLGASLPGLSLDTKPAISVQEFRNRAAEHLCARDLEALSQLDSLWEFSGNHPFVSQWRNRETALRNALVRARASALKKDPEQYLKPADGYFTDAERAAAEAASKASPLEKEQCLDKHRWKVLDEMAGFSSFTGSAILAYSLRLQIAQRWAEMSEEAGKKIAERVVTADTGSSETADGISENNENSE